MDYSFSLNSFMYPPLRDMLVTSKNSPSTTSWPSLADSSPVYLPSNLADSDDKQQLQTQHDNAAATNRHQTHAQVENALHLQSVSASLPTTIYLTSCHPFHSNAAIINTGTNNYDMNMLQASDPSSSLSQLSSNALSPYYNILSQMDLSQSSSTCGDITCVDPSSLMLNASNSDSSRANSTDSSCFSSPGTRRNSSFSISGGSSGEEDQQTSMQSFFSQDFLVSVPPVMPLLVCSDSDKRSSTPLLASAADTSVTYGQDFFMPDGTVFRFDGNALVPATSVHYSNLPEKKTSPVMPPMLFTNSALIDCPLSMLMPQQVQSLHSYMLFDSASSPMLSGVDNDDYKSAVSTRTSADRLRKTAGAAASKKRVIKNGGSNRRSIMDFPSSSSSSVVKSSSASPSLGYNSNHNKYRKDGAGEFQCPFDGCSYRYNLRRELNRHKNVHLFAGKDKYRCMNCNSGLCRLDSVKRHMEAKGKAGCLKKGLYQEFKENGELIRVRKCKPSWYEAAAANVAASAVVSGSASSSASATVLRSL